jgi:hypothetical protein
MSISRKTYELSLWSGDGSVRICTIGSNTMQSYDRALEPKLVCNINGENSLTFKMHYWYINPNTGIQTTNSLASQIDNESIIKLFLPSAR